MSSTDLEAALHGLRAAVRLGRMRGIAQEQREAASGAVQRRILDASDAGADLVRLAEAIGCTPNRASTRLARARRDYADRIPDEFVTLDAIAARLGVGRDRIAAYRRAGRLPTRQLHGTEVASERDVKALEDSLLGRGRPPLVVSIAPAPPRLRGPNVWLDVPRCARPAPPPWPVCAHCWLPKGHREEHNYDRSTRPGRTD